MVNRYRQVMDTVRRELRSRADNGDRFIKALCHFCRHIQHQRWSLAFRPIADLFEDFADGLSGLRKTNTAGKYSTV